MEVISERDLFNALPSEIRLEVEHRQLENLRRGRQEFTFQDAYRWEVSQLVEVAMRCERPEVTLCTWRQAGEQWIAEFFVNDLAKPLRGEYNWHLQNTSQWSYAGCILIQNGRVSTHH